jgi:hypothetical protein
MGSFGHFQTDHATQAYYTVQWNRRPQPLNTIGLHQQWPMFPHYGQPHALHAPIPSTLEHVIHVPLPPQPFSNQVGWS